MARKQSNRSIRKSIFVLGDGQTEQYYFKHLKSLKEYNYKIRPRLFDDLSFEDAEDHIDQLLSGDADLIFYFTDYDTIINQGKKEKFQQFRNKYQANGNVFILESMPSIEFWFLLHFRKTTQRFRNSKDVEKELKKKLRDYSKRKQYLQKPSWVEKLCEGEQLEDAIKRACELLKEKQSITENGYFPYTKIHVGIEKFEELKSGFKKN
jgi:hypothetical protein